MGRAARVPARAGLAARRRRWLAVAQALAVAAAVVVSAPPPSRAQEIADPLEPVNRAVFGFNMTLDDWVLEPVARAYRYVAPEPVRRSVANFLRNLRSPVVFANDLLQGERERAGVTLGRFMINSTLGVFGLFDAANAFGYAAHDEDLGQTFGVWGLPSGPYLMLPLLGPSSVRDAGGRVGDYFINPLNHCCVDTDEWLALYGTGTVSDREANIEVFDDLKENSLDLYAAVRSIYAQRRAAEIRNGAPAGDQERYDEIFQDEELE